MIGPAWSWGKVKFCTKNRQKNASSHHRRATSPLLCTLPPLPVPLSKVSKITPNLSILPVKSRPNPRQSEKEESGKTLSLILNQSTEREREGGRRGRERDGDPVRAGGEGIGGAGGVQRDVDERDHDRAADTGEDPRHERHERLLLPRSLHLPRQAHRWPHRSLYGRRHRRK